jgi:glycosyltransferase involved in cell wall biosynthesis
MEILVVSQYFWPENFRINDLCRELQSRGHQVTVLTGIPNYPEGKTFPEFRSHKQKFEDYFGVKIVRAPLIPRGTGKISLALNYMSFMLTASTLGPLMLRGKKFDLVFVCQLSPATVAVPGIVMAYVKRTPLSMWILDLWPDSLKAVGIIRNARILRWIESAMKKVYRQCDIIFVQSDSFKVKILSSLQDGPEVRHIPTWAEVEFDALEAEQTPTKSQRFVVTFAGNIGTAQDMDCIINAGKILKSHPNIEIQLVGHGRDADRVARLIKEFDLEDTVKMLGRLPLEQMPNIFSQSEALLVTLSDEEIFAMTVPGKLQSYLAFGKPVIGSINGEAMQVINDSGAGYCVASGDFDGLAKAIIEMSKMPTDARNEMGRNGREYYNRVFDRTKIIDQFETELSKLV